jgi:hypothetical protein
MREEMDLYQYFLDHQGRRIIKHMHYFPIYQRFFSRFVGQSVLMFEIGTGEGGSAQMWKRYFGPLSRIVTLDIRDNSRFAESQIFPRQGDQSDPEALSKLVEEFGTPDIVFDDASHINHLTKATFEFLYPKLNNNGIYLVEDLDTAYFKRFGGGLRAEGSFIEFCKGLIDEMHAEYTLRAIEPTDFTRSVFSINFFDQVVVFEKMAHANKEVLYLPPQPENKA